MAVPSPDTELARLSYPATRRLKEALMDGDAWRAIADHMNLIDSGALRVCDSRSTVDNMLAILEMHGCTVGALCMYLRALSLYDVLATLVEEEELEITKQPDADGGVVSVERGGTLRLQCEARGVPGPRYLWCRENEQLREHTASVLLIHNFGLDQQGCYYCEVSQPGRPGSPVHSQEVEVSLAPELPRIVRQPDRSVFLLSSTPALLECRAEAHPPPSYQWFHHNLLLAGCTSPVLQIPYVSSKDEGEYRCRVDNAAGEVFSEPCILKTYKRPPDNESPSSVPKVSIKVALLIGNRNYEHVAPLRTPWEDVVTLAAILVDKGFMVIALKDLTLVEMRSALRLFCRLLCKAAYGVFYFAGHGFELTHKYMMPVDVPGMFCPSSCMSVNEVIHCAQMRRPHLILLIPDMCLVQPSSIVLLGLAGRRRKQEMYQDAVEDFQLSGDKNILIACTTTSGQRAYECDTEVNGEYMMYLKRFLGSDLPIEEVLRRVRCSMPGEQSPLDMSNVAQSYMLSAPAEGNREAEERYAGLSELKEELSLVFPEVRLRCLVRCQMFACFHNALRLVFHGVDKHRWNLRCKLPAAQDVLVDHVTGEQHHEAVIHNLQKAKLYKRAELSLQVTVSLYERQHDACRKVSNAILDLGYPLITTADLWLPGASCRCNRCSKGPRATT